MVNGDLNEVEGKRKELILYLRSMGINPFGEKFVTLHTNKELKKEFDKYGNEEIKAKGRVIAIRGHGKASFVVVRDFSSDIQLYFRFDNLGEEKYKFFKKALDIGDIIGAKGVLFKTHTDEITVEVKDFILLSKSIRLLPEKWHGLKDSEIRYRKRYLDLIANREVLDLFVKRSEIVDAIRAFLKNKGFLEVETPMLQSVAGGAMAKPFTTYYNALDQNMYLRIAPELYLKRLIIGGFEKVFELNRNFRNEGLSAKHNPEFTMMEVYWAYADYKEMMILTEELIYATAKEVLGKESVQFKEDDINLSPPFSRISFAEAFKKYTDIDVDELRDTERAKKVLETLDIRMNKPLTFGNVINEIFDKRVETHFVQPTFVYDYPLEISPLAKRKNDDPHTVERFELFIGGMEIANAFSELNDPIDQYKRFKGQLEAKNDGGEETHMMDTDYIEAMEYGLPPTGGLGIGIDRLIMLLTGKESIREVILFPQLKTKTDDEEKE
ncbi:MAG: lysine--tRNA ligase [Caldisericota bacterium]|nr:lysine--tRNA ligase [Caldisericota bacterium]